VSGRIHFRKEVIRDAEARLSPLSPSAGDFAGRHPDVAQVRPTSATWSFAWDQATVDRLGAIRGRGESYSDVIVRVWALTPAGKQKPRREADAAPSASRRTRPPGRGARGPAARFSCGGSLLPSVSATFSVAQNKGRSRVATPFPSATAGRSTKLPAAGQG
jgi:hypothetical protein